MNLFDRLRAAIRAFVLGPYVVDSFDRYYGHDISQYSPTEYGDYISTSNGVYVCSTQRAQFLSSLPIKLYKNKKNGQDREEIVKGDLYDLLQKVNPFWTFTRLIEMTELTLCVWGQAFWFLERGESGKRPPAEIWWGRPDRVRVIPHPEKYIEGYLYEPLTGAAPIAYTAGEVLWFRYPNPVDEFAPLSPLAAARLAADYASAAMKSNKNLFENGMQLGGMLTPKSGSIFTEEQAKALELALERRFKGVDKAHRWGVLRAEAEIKDLGFSPEEAQFLGGLAWSLEDICRAYHWPLDLVGGQRTYENVNAAMQAAWTNAIIPEARWIGNELTEQLLPMFTGQADYTEFDTSDIDVLQEDETLRWKMQREQIQVGAITVNEWRKEQGMDPVDWGDEPPSKISLAEEMPVPEAETPAPEEEAPPRAHTEYATRAIEYGSLEHQRLWNRFVRRSDQHEKAITKTVVGLFERQRESVLDRLRGKRQSPADEPFDKAEWIKRFRTEIRPVLLTVVEGAGVEALDDLGLVLDFDVKAPAVVRFLERRAQRFARRVNDTTWNDLKASLSEGIDSGENITQLQERVLNVMAGRIRSTPETIARTETIGAMNGGSIEAWRQSEVVESKTWLSALDDRTREPPESEFDHRTAHGETVHIDEPFVQTGEPLMFPGADEGSAGNVVNCRCSMTAGLRQRAILSSNGRQHALVSS